MKALTLITDIVATRRLTKLILDDKITEDLRETVFDRFPPNTTKTGYLLTCPWCVSIWAGAAIFALRAANPGLADYVSGVLTASQVAGLATERGY